MGKPARIKSIEIWRLVFTISIVLCHGVLLVQERQIKVSTLGVEFFFILSGFLMANSVRKTPVYAGTLGEDTWRFLFRKIKPIYPVYLFAVLAEILCSAFFRKDFDISVFPYYIYDLLFLRAAGWKKTGLTVLVGASWYIMAMFLAMAVIYPLLRKNTDSYLHIVAPLIAVFVCGWFSIAYGKIDQALQYDYNLCLGFLRAFAELNFGCFAYLVCEKVKRRYGQDPTWKTRAFWTAAEILPMAIVLYIATHLNRGNSDFACILLLGAGIAASFSGLGYTNLWLEKVNVGWIGRLSLAVYLNHYTFYRLLSVKKLDWPLEYQLLLLFALSIFTSVLCLACVGIVEKRRRNQ